MSPEGRNGLKNGRPNVNFKNMEIIFKDELLNSFANQLLNNGFRLLVPVKPSTYFHYEKDGKIGYCQVSYWGGLTFSTVHKPATGIGTGYGLHDGFHGIFEPTIKDAESAFIHSPKWAKSHEAARVVKYKSLEDYMSSTVNRIIESEILETVEN